MRPSYNLSLASVLVVACGRQLPDPSAAVELWIADREAAVEVLASLGSEREQAMVVELLVLHHGTTMLREGRCAGIPPGAPTRRCEQLLGRAHLYQEGSVVAEAAPTPLDWELPACGGGRTPSECALGRALEEAASGGASPWVACEGLTQPTLRSECGFQLGEALVRRQGAAGYEGAVRACLGTERFAEPCLDHLSSELARAWAGSRRGCFALEEEPWAEIERRAEVVRGFWAERDTTRGERLAEVLQAVAARAALGGTTRSERRSNFERSVEGEATPSAPLRALRWDVGALHLATVTEGTDPTHPSGGTEASTGRLSELARALVRLEPDFLLIEGVHDESALLALRDASACLGGPAYGHHRLEAEGASLLSLLPLAHDGTGPAGRWAMLPDSQRELREPFLLDGSGRPLPYNPASKIGFSSQLPVAWSLVAAH